MANIGPWPKGMNNMIEDHVANSSEIPLLRNAVNIDFNNIGMARRRKGLRKVISAIDPRNGFSCPAGAYFVENGCLKIFNANQPATTIYQGIYGQTCTFDYLNGLVYFSDGLISLKIDGGIVSKWGMSRPSAPVLSGVAGTYGGGTYLAALCWVDENGVESGASEIVSVSLPDNTGIVFNNLPIKED